MFSQSGTKFDPITKIWSGPRKKQFYSSEMTLGEVILGSLSLNKKKVIQVCDTTGQSLTAGELLEQSKAVAAHLIRMGLKPGDVVGIAAANTTNLTAIVIGAFLIGTPTHCVYPDFDMETMKTIYTVSKPKILFCDDKNYDIVKEVVNKLDLNAKIFIVDGKVQNVPSVSELFIDAETHMIQRFPCSELNGNTVAMILCSSGTSGPPKGVLNTHTTLLNQESYFNLDEESVLFSFSTLYWSSGVWTLIASLKACVKRIITNKPFTPDYFMDLFEKHKITHTFVSPNQIAEIVSEYDSKSRDKLKNLHTALCGGAKVSGTVLTKFNEILGDVPRPGLTVVFGMTETGGICVLNDAGPGKRRILNGGRLAPNIQMRIVDETGQNLGVNEQGMILIKVPYEWPGYLKNSKATNDTLLNGWIKSGDIGFIDEEGYLNICARDSEVFKSGGFQIFPPHIEEIIMQISGVLEVCVFGVPDDKMTNLIACAIVVTNDTNGSNLTKSDVEQHVKNKLAKVYNLTGGVYFMDSFPHTGSGKIIRKKVADLIMKRD